MRGGKWQRANSFSPRWCVFKESGGRPTEDGPWVVFWGRWCKGRGVQGRWGWAEFTMTTGRCSCLVLLFPFLSSLLCTPLFLSPFFLFSFVSHPILSTGVTCESSVCNGKPTLIFHWLSELHGESCVPWVKGGRRKKDSYLQGNKSKDMLVKWCCSSLIVFFKLPPFKLHSVLFMLVLN